METGTIKLQLTGTSSEMPAADDERGAGMVEYALLVFLIAVVALVAVKSFGLGVSSQFSTIVSNVG